MKKILSLILVLSFVLTMFVGCGLGKSGYELALVTDLGTIDDKSFNQGSWEGLKKYAEEHKDIPVLSASEGTNTAYLESIDLAIRAVPK